MIEIMRQKNINRIRHAKASVVRRIFTIIRKGSEHVFVLLPYLYRIYTAKTYIV